MLKFKSFFVLLVVLALSAAAHAELTESAVQQWIKANEGIQTWSKQNGDVLEKLEQENPDLALGNVEEVIKGQPYYDELISQLNSYGYDSLEQYMDLSFQIFAASLDSTMIDQFKAALLTAKSILESESLEPKTSAMLKNNVDSMEKLLEYVNNTSNAEREVVEQYRPQIEQQMK